MIMSDDYKPNSVDAVLSRLESKLDAALQKGDGHDEQIRKIWATLSRLDVRVSVIGGGIVVAVELGKWILGTH